ncbi:MAG: asparagine synthetase B, partial [Candidatus Omnitrophica bacterium]|nr:asparagine synthetase B [Candidatus Omnitrophota bacterium]
MCGIFGMLGDRDSRQLAQGVLAALEHRGPDDQGIQEFDEGWMAHTRLSIIDLSPLGRQPMANAAGTAWIVYNGELYNYLELREELKDYPFRTRTDTEVILAAYDRWGVDCLGRFQGMFAFGLWDLGRKRLLCATDRFSIKPLYYAQLGNRLLFSSEIKPLALCGVRLRPNEAAVYDYLAFGLLDHGSDTLFEGVHQLQPATSLLVEQGQHVVRKYWDLTQAADPGDAQPKDEPSTLASIETALLAAVRLHLRSDV